MKGELEPDRNPDIAVNSNVRSSANIIVREIGGPAEMRAVEDLQKDVWGIPDLDVVPLTQLVAAKAAGGVLLGAFDADKLAGFAFGFVGLENGHATHHSHMLAVRPEYRNYNLGGRLKFAQREFVLAQGIDEMTWTFDPLQSLNAYFNFERLGVISKCYLTDFYGADPASFLHQTGTDRLWVKWQLRDVRVQDRASRLDRPAPPPQPDTAIKLVEFGRSGEPVINDIRPDKKSNHVTIEIPGDINSLSRHDNAMAKRWREATRNAFSEYIAAGFVVVGFVRGQSAGKYILERNISHLELAKFGLVDI